MPSGRYEIYGLSQDITALARARDDAKAAAQKLKLALTTARAGVFEIDFGARRFTASSEFTAMVSPDVQAAGPEHPLPFFHADDRAVLTELYEQTQQSQSACAGCGSIWRSRRRGAAPPAASA
jgi:hypothetical protein